MKRFIMTLAGLALITTLFAGSATAHARFASSNPAPGQTLASAPASVSITFTEDLAFGSTGSVVNAAGATVSTGAAYTVADRKLLIISLTPGLPNGTYTVNWHTVSSEDGDQLDGSFSFSIAVAAAAPAAPAAPAPALAPVPARTLPSTSTLPTDDRSGLALVLIVSGLFLGALSLRAARGTRA